MNMSEVPIDFVNMVNHALLIISWQENLVDDEMPPYWIWHLDWELEDWFRKVKIKRDEKYGTSSSETRDNINDTHADGSPMFERNELFDEFLT